jgi:hypothetical protein
MCGHAVEHTVTVYTGAPRVASCPSIPSPSKAAEAITLVEIFGAWGASPWTGTKTVWDAQPAWMTEYDAQGAPVTPCPSASGPTAACPSAVAASELLTTTIALPWLNAKVVVEGATAARTQELLGRVSVRAPSAMTVPASASKMTVSWATTFPRSESSTSRSDIEQTLSALRALLSLPISAACEIPAMLGPVVGGKVVTFESNGTETSFLVAAAPCGQVTSGSGVASRVDAALSAALAKVPLTLVR